MKKALWVLLVVVGAVVGYRAWLAGPTVVVSIRFPVETLARLRALGPGWQGVVVRAVEKELGEGLDFHRPEIGF